jgi:hypothetical protein
VPIIGPFIGGAIGAYIYDFFIGASLTTPIEVPVGREVEDPSTGRPVDT